MRQHRQLGVLLLTGLVLLLGLVQARHELGSSGVEIERFRLADAFNTPAIRFLPPAEKRSGVVAVLVHGHECNKAMMAQLARFLAAGGVDAYAIDLPGHGESLQAFSDNLGRQATEAAVANIVERTGGAVEKLVLVGHSFGAEALGPAAVRRDLLATVFIGPGKPEGLSRRLPNNALIVTAEHDYPYIKQDAQAMYADLTARDSRPAGNLVGDFRLKDARLWEEIPQATHLSLLFDQRVHRLVALWIERSGAGSMRVQSAYAMGPALRAAALALALVLVLTALAASTLSALRTTPTRDPAGHWAPAAIATMAGVYFSELMINGLLPLGYAQFAERDILVAHLGATGVLGIVFLASMGGAISFRCAAIDLAAAALALLALYGLTLLTIDAEFYSLRITYGSAKNLATLALAALLALPIFLLQDELLRRLQGRHDRGVRGFVVYCAGCLALAVLFCASLHFVDARLYRFNAEILAGSAYCAVAGAILRAYLKNGYAAVWFSALVAGWVISVGFLHS